MGVHHRAPFRALLRAGRSVAFVFALAPGLALAQRPHASDAVRAVPLPADAVRRLKSNDDAQIRSALDDVRVSGKAGAGAVPAILDLLEHGLTSDLTVAALETLADTESEGATPSLAWYAHHRNVTIRRAAVEGLARTRGAAATPALRAALSDPDPGVRGLAATGLGTLKAKEALADLFLALDHKVLEASGSIGRICVGAECDRLAAKLGSLPFDVVTSGLDQALSRPLAEVNDDIKVKIVARVRELGTAQANHFLHDVQTRWPKSASQRVKQAIDQAVLATSASPGSGEAAQ